MCGNKNSFSTILFLFISIGIFGVFIPIKAQSKRALLVGISEYPANKAVSEATWGAIHGTNDVELVKKTLKSQGFKITNLTNSNATASKIRKALSKMQSEATSGDLVYIHFSCHGQPVEDLDGDEADGWDEAIVPYDAWKKSIKGVYEGQNHILDDELNASLRKIREKVGVSGFVYVVIDACHAGGSDRGEEEEYLRGTQDGFSQSNKKYIPRIDARSNIPIEAVSGLADICMLEACRAYQSNFEIKQNGTFYGPLSFYVNHVLRQHPLDKDTFWVESVSTLMKKKLTKQNMVIQTTKK